MMMSLLVSLEDASVGPMCTVQRHESLMFTCVFCGHFSSNDSSVD